MSAPAEPAEINGTITPLFIYKHPILGTLSSDSIRLYRSADRTFGFLFYSSTVFKDCPPPLSPSENTVRAPLYCTSSPSRCLVFATSQALQVRLPNQEPTSPEAPSFFTSIGVLHRTVYLFRPPTDGSWSFLISAAKPSSFLILPPLPSTLYSPHGAALACNDTLTALFTLSSA